MVVNVTSRFGSIARCANGDFRGLCPYSIAKCAQNMLTVCLDREQSYFEDCPVCCRPIEVFVRSRPGELLSISVSAD